MKKDKEEPEEQAEKQVEKQEHTPLVADSIVRTKGVHISRGVL